MLNELLVKIKSKEKVQNKLNDLLFQKQELEVRLKQQKKVVCKENDDVEKLEYGSLASFFSELLGNKEAKLAKEREEAYQAKMLYDSLEYQLSDVQKGIAYYENQLEEIRDCEAEYQDLYASKVEELKVTDVNLEQYEKDLISSRSNLKEIHEALQAGESALKIADKVLRKLDSAKGWSTYDLIGGGGISDLMKYSHLDDAQKLINELQSQLSRFKTELLDVQISLHTNIEIDSFLRFADFWFDGIFSSMAVYDKIKNSIAQIKSTRESISNVIGHLKDLYTNELKNEAYLKEKIDKIVLES